MYNPKSIGVRIRALRRQHNLTQNELADKLNISYQAISSWENGSTIPDVENICKLAVIFHVAVDVLLRNDQPKAMIAVDGGGTKSEFALFFADGRVVKRFKLEGTNAAVYGLDTVIDTLCKGIDMCVNEMVEIGSAFVGTAGPYLPEIEKKLAEHYPKLQIKVESDGVNALCSAEGDAALICGTGSILILKDGDGIRRIGGRGYMLGDYGSAFNFGRAVLRLAADYEDGVCKNSRYHKNVCDKLGCSSLRMIKLGGEVAFIASLSNLLFEAYLDGDNDAEVILQQEAKGLATLVNASCEKGSRIILCGGMFEHYGDILLPILKECVKPEIEFIIPELPPIFGACVRACHLAGLGCDKEFKINFLHSENKKAYD